MRWCGWAMVVVLAGCWGGGDLGVAPGPWSGWDDELCCSSPPALSVQVNKLPLGPNAKCQAFKPDTTFGQIKQHKEVLIRNTGALVGTTVQPLCVRYSWQSDDPQLKLGSVSGKVTHPRCPADMLAITAVHGALKFDVVFAPDPEALSSGKAVLTLETNSPGQPRIEICFEIGKMGALLDYSAFCFEDAKPSAPPTQCFAFGNMGTKELCFRKATIEPPNPAFTIVGQPAEGECIRALGTGDNQPTKLKKLEVCVRYAPSAVPGPDEAKLRIETQRAGETPEANYVSLCHKLDPNSTYTVACEAAVSGSLGYDFEGLPSGVQERCCTVTNEGPGALSFGDCEVVPLTPYSGEVQLSKAFQTTLLAYDGPAGDYFEVPSLPYALAKSKTGKVCLKYTPQGSKQPPPAYLRCHLHQDNQLATLALPIDNNGCSGPVLVTAPPVVEAQAGVGNTAKSQVLIGNQSCAPLTLVQACVAPAPFKGDPCSKPSESFALPSPFAPVTVPPWGIHALELAFSPKYADKPSIDDMLHLSWCQGAWTNGACSGDLHTEALMLHGSTGEVARSPLLTCPEDVTGTVGKPVEVECKVAPGAADSMDEFLWGMLQRPDGSHTWIATDEQVTFEPQVGFVPDLPGEYRILGLARSVTPYYPWGAMSGGPTVTRVKVTK